LLDIGLADVLCLISDVLECLPLGMLRMGGDKLIVTV
jgi:hypothetical protein